MRTQDATPDSWVIVYPPGERQRIGIVERRAKHNILVRTYAPDGPALVGDVIIPLTPGHIWIQARYLRRVPAADLRPEIIAADTGYREGVRHEQARRDRAFRSRIMVLQNQADRRTATALGRMADLAYKHETGEDRPADAPFYIIRGTLTDNKYLQLTPSPATGTEEETRMLDEQVITYRQAIIAAAPSDRQEALQAVLDDSQDAARLLRLYMQMELTAPEALDLLTSYKATETRDQMLADAQAAMNQWADEAAAQARTAADATGLGTGGAVVPPAVADLARDRARRAPEAPPGLYADPAAAAVLYEYQRPEAPPTLPSPPPWTAEEIAYREAVRAALPESFRDLLGDDPDSWHLCHYYLPGGVIPADAAEVLLSMTLGEPDEDGYILPGDPGGPPVPDATADPATVRDRAIRLYQEEGAEEIERIGSENRLTRDLLADVERRFGTDPPIPRDLPPEATDPAAIIRANYPPDHPYRRALDQETAPPLSDAGRQIADAVLGPYITPPADPGSGPSITKTFRRDPAQDYHVDQTAEIAARIKAGLQRSAAFNVYFSEADAETIAATLAARGMRQIAESLADQLPRELSAAEAADWFYQATTAAPEVPDRDILRPPGASYRDFYQNRPISEEPGPGGKPYPGAPGGDYKLR